MNQSCRVCGEVAAGYHFGAFTCEGCKSFFGRTYNNRSSIGECKNNNQCVINKKNRTSCKSCRLKKCFTVGMSKSGSRYGRRSNWFKIHCLLQDQGIMQQQQQQPQSNQNQNQQPQQPTQQTQTLTPSSQTTNQQTILQEQQQQQQQLEPQQLHQHHHQHSHQQHQHQLLQHLQMQQQASMSAVAAAAAVGPRDTADSVLYQTALAQILYYCLVSQSPAQQSDDSGRTR